MTTRKSTRQLDTTAGALRIARPFLKWAGGKRQLIEAIDARLPAALRAGNMKYCEPFVGGGAVFFHVVQNYPVRDIFLADLNPELMLAYRAIQRDVEQVIVRLGGMQETHLALDEAGRKGYFYETRANFNRRRAAIHFDQYGEDWAERCAHIIYLNQTCYNGLFRVNSKGEFNVPFGRYKRPAICNAANLRAVSRMLQGATLHLGDFTDVQRFVDENTLVYFDPPYRPISRTANFKSYSAHDFDDSEQLRLAAFYRRLDGMGAKLMLSNSDPKNERPEDDFFERAYAGFRIERVEAMRNINSNSRARGAIRELLICNWPVGTPLST